ncbi:permease [Rummeliibacillus suwonensis]|uniref:permease n=1 Tax=Rummeliibacillus suwonensis TaxID=1306154 RepID=UPI001AAE31CF|nr:permease [Rummeliibacillus suwonensis]MBO2537229.1 permease [Rummeliibacillus suwonensis]
MSDTIVKVLLEFLSLSKNLLVLFVGISFFLNFIQAYIPFNKLENWMKSKNPLLGNLAGAVLGFVTPFCSCSTIPLLVTMINRNVPFQTVMTYLFSSPLLDPWILGLMAYIYGIKVTILYTITTFIFSMIIGWYLDKRNYQEHVKKVIVKGNIPEQDTARRKDLVLNLKLSIKEMWELVRSVLVYILIGAFIGAIIKEAVPTTFLNFISNQNQWWVIPLAAIIGVPLYIRLSTMLPIAQGLLVNGFPVAPTMALLIGGAGASLPEIIMLKSIFSKKLVSAFIVSVFLMATFSGYLFLLIEI